MYHWLEAPASKFLGADNSNDLEWRLVLGAWLYLLSFGLITIVLPAPYGKFSEQASRLPLMDLLTAIKLPAPIAWSVQEMPALTYSLITVISFGLNSCTLYLLPFIAHYANRSLLYPLLLNKSSRGVPLLTISNAFLFCLYNGLLQSQVVFPNSPAFEIHPSIIHPSPHHHPLVQAIVNMDPSTLIQSLSWLGLFLFLLGMAINIHSDSILRGLRAPGESGYRIPHGGFFSLISAPNYFGETLEWGGYAAFAQVRFSC